MFYGGGILCWGWPSGNLKEDYFNFGQYWKDSYNQPGITKTNTDLKSQIDLIKKFFK